MDPSFPRVRLRRLVYLLGLFALVVLSSATFAQEAKESFSIQGLTLEAKVLPADPFHDLFKANAKGNSYQVRPGEVVRVVIAGTPQAQYYTYPVSFKGPKQESYLSKLVVGKVPGAVPLPPILESQPDLAEGKYTHSRPFTWSQDVVILPGVKPGPFTVPVQVRSQVCDERKCSPFTANLQARLIVSDEKELPLTPELTKRIQDSQADATLPDKSNGAKPQPEVGGPITGTAEEYQTSMALIKAQIRNTSTITSQSSADLLGFIMAGIFWGAISLVTPCVFPMIPITVSFFLKQAEKEHHKPVQTALVYSVTIIIVLTLAAAFLLSIFRILSINPIMNYALGGLFIFFALSLFGMYDIELPSGLARFTSAREGQGGMIGTIFMALTFTIISFACVAPFLGGFGGTAATQARPMWHNLLGGLAFSATFAAPFFFLALFPTLLKKMPKSGSWLNTVKVVMGFLELAAAFVFFRTAELVMTGGTPWLFTFDFVLGIYIALSFLCGLYLLGIFRLPHDTPEEHLGVIRMLFAGLFITFGFYLMPGLFKIGDHGNPQRPGGTIYAWVEAFLLPEGRPGKELPHSANLEAAVAKAREVRQQTGNPQRIFVDFTGVSCKNCNLNEQNVFPKPAIHKLLQTYSIVKLYTDTVPRQYYDGRVNVNIERQEADADVNLKFQKDVFDNEQLPLYVILEPQLDDTIDVIAVYDEGRINHEAAFAEFLRDPK